MRERLPAFLVVLLLTALVLVIGAVVLSRRRTVRTDFTVSIACKADLATNDATVATAIENALASQDGVVRIRSESTARGSTVALTFEGRSRDEIMARSGALRSAAFEQRKTLPPQAGPPTVSWRTAGETIWVFAPTDVSAELGRVAGVERVDVCGQTTGQRLLVSFNNDYLDRRGLALTDFPLHALPPRLEELSEYRVGSSKLSDVALITSGPRPSRCRASLIDGGPVVAHAVHLLPDIAKAERARILGLPDAIMLHDEGVRRARYFLPRGEPPSLNLSAYDKITARAKASLVPLVANVLHDDGTGALFFRAPVDEEIATRILAEGAWGGFEDDTVVEVLVQGSAEGMDARVKEVIERVSAIDTLRPLAVGPEPENATTWRVDEKGAREAGFDPQVLHAIADALSGDDADAPVALDLPSYNALSERRFARFLYPSNGRREVRRVRIGRERTVELAWKRRDGKEVGASSLEAVGKAIGPLPDVTVRARSGFADFAAF